MAVANTWSKSMKWQISIPCHTPQLIKIPTSSYVWSPKKVPLFGRVSLPIQAVRGSSPNPPPLPPRIKWLGELRSTTSYFTQTRQQNFAETAHKNTRRIQNSISQETTTNKVVIAIDILACSSCFHNSAHVMFSGNLSFVLFIHKLCIHVVVQILVFFVWNLLSLVTITQNRGK